MRAEGQVSPARAGSARLAGSELGRNSDRRPRACCGGPCGGRGGVGGGEGAGAALRAAAGAGAPVLWPPLAGGSEAPRSDSLRFPGGGVPVTARAENPPAPSLVGVFCHLQGFLGPGLLRSEICARSYFSSRWDGKVALTSS